MLDQLSSWVKAAGGRRVLLVGDLILDRYIYGDAERISPEAPVAVLRTVEKREAVGGSANVASCLVALGCRVACCGVIGDDRHGRRLTELLDALGVESSSILRLADRPTTTKTRLVGLAQHRHRQQLLRVDDEDTTPLGASSMEALTKLVVKEVERCDVVCVEDYDKGVVSDELVRRTVKAAREQNKPVLTDPARLPDYERYRGSTYVTPNRQELALACGESFADLDSLATHAAGLMERYDIQTVVATVDREGAVLVEQGGSWQHFPTMPRSVYDNTGAGDAVLAMLAAALAAGAPDGDAVQLANIAGGLEVERFGCVPITADEVLAELRLKSRMQNGKVKTSAEVAAELALRRDRGETVVFTNGCFDILHAGHVDFLRRCRQEGSLLVVGLNSDSSIRTLEKGDDRPINHFEDRGTVLAALECVDYVVGFDDSNPENLVRDLRPDVLAKGEDWAGKPVAGAEFVKSIGGRVAFLPLVEGLSTTTLVERIRQGKS
ncbi:MAG: PfkB family carbohydrate kinase [Planctomycetota bacterium]|jgi:D-beta-D-heptose 7-phosphate kinase/D-beta-D-heptose 1-phosphate adenosyltransferase